MPAEPKLIEYAYRISQDVPTEVDIVKFEKFTKKFKGKCSNDVKKDYKLAYLKIEELSGEKIEKPDSIKDSVILNSKDIKNNSNIKGQRCGVCNKIFKLMNVNHRKY